MEFKKPKEMLDKFLRRYKEIDNTINLDIAKTLIKEAVEYYSGINKAVTGSYQKYLENRWYKALNNNEIDFAVYGDKYYFIDVWACWIMYSRKYLKAIIKHNSLTETRSIYSVLKDVESVLDLGCGIGYTTKALKQMFIDAEVYGTNIPGTMQYKFCERLSEEYNFKLIPDINNVTYNIDLVFASEYFEHIKQAINHLEEIIFKLSPKFLYIANSFNTHSVGHFTKYVNTGGLISTTTDQAKISKLFNLTLKSNGYKKIKTKLWNNKPTLWERQR